MLTLVAPRRDRRLDTMERIIPDHLSAHGARCLAAHITSYWQSKGYGGIKVWTAPINQSELDYPQLLETHVIRSNIGPNGFPPKH